MRPVAIDNTSRACHLIILSIPSGKAISATYRNRKDTVSAAIIYDNGFLSGVSEITSDRIKGNRYSPAGIQNNIIRYQRIEIIFPAKSGIRIPPAEDMTF